MDENHSRGTISAEQALELLISGNQRFLNGTSRLRKLTRADFSDLARGQHPFATILGCSDSRVPPELIFDTGPGDLFVVRVAGNVFSPEVAGSLQYAGSHLNTQLFVVLGHEGCGAVAAALANRDEGAEHRSRIQLLVNAILPGLPQSNSDSPEARISEAVESNVRWTVRQILETPEGRMRVAEGRMKIVGAIYDVASGRLRLLPE
jgi:carbonic anhydrase